MDYHGENMIYFDDDDDDDDDDDIVHSTRPTVREYKCRSTLAHDSVFLIPSQPVFALSS